MFETYKKKCNTLENEIRELKEKLNTMLEEEEKLFDWEEVRERYWQLNWKYDGFHWLDTDSIELDLFPYQKLFRHPEYNSRWRGSFFDKEHNFINDKLKSGVLQESTAAGEQTSRWCYDIEKSYKRFYTKSIYSRCFYILHDFFLCLPEHRTTFQEDLQFYLDKGLTYEQAMEELSAFSLFGEGPHIHKDIYQDYIHSFLGHCDGYKVTEDGIRLHFEDPTGNVLLPPQQISIKLADQMLNHICLFTAISNRTRIYFPEIQILPYALYEKTGEYETDTIYIRQEDPLEQNEIEKESCAV